MDLGLCVCVCMCVRVCVLVTYAIAWGDEAGVSAVITATGLVATYWLTP